jgi:hypothetical protein
VAKKKRPTGPPKRPGSRTGGAPGSKPNAESGERATARSNDTPIEETPPGETTAAAAAEGGPNRAARKEAARREREALQRKMARRRTVRIVAIVTAVALVAGGVTVYVVTRPAKVNTACGLVKVIPPFSPASRDREHIASAATTPALADYRSIPPASGPHNPTPLNSGIYSSPPDIYMAIHALEHAAVEVWLSPSASGDERLKIENFYRSGPQADHVIIAPYQYPGPAGQLPAGVQMALVAWHHVQTCGGLSLASVQKFVASYRVMTGAAPTKAYKGDAPEAGVAI